MNSFKNYIDRNYVIILIIGMAFLVLRGCFDSTSRDIKKINKSISNIESNTYTKTELDRELKIMGLESEKRMIQATDRKLIDVQRQTEIETEIKKLKEGK